MTIFWRTLRSRTRSFVWWSASLVALVWINVAVYPSIRDQQGFTDLIEGYPDFVKEILGLGSGLSIAEPAGYLNSQVFANLLPLVLIIFFISFAAKETAGDERAGILDLVAAHPVRRRQVMLEKAGATLTAGAGLAVVSIITLIATTPLAGMDISIGVLVGATTSVFLAALVFAGVAFGMGAATGNRGISVGASSGFAVASFVVFGLAPLVEGISSLEILSPFFWALTGDPIINGLQPGNALLMLGLSVAFIAIGIWRFEKRDIAV